MKYYSTVLERELERLGVKNDPEPSRCPKCKEHLILGEGMVGETVLYCLEHGIVWEDSEGALARVL